jgi:hypothetical protein
MALPAAAALPHQTPWRFTVKHSYPVAFVAEFRGIEPPRSFNDRDTGEVVQLGAVLKLERDAGDGDVASVQVRLAAAGKPGPSLDVEPHQLKRGEHLQVSGEVVLYSDRPGYFKAIRVTRATSNGRQPAATS